MSRSYSHHSTPQSFRALTPVNAEIDDEIRRQRAELFASADLLLADRSSTLNWTGFTSTSFDLTRYTAQVILCAKRRDLLHLLKGAFPIRHVKTHYLYAQHAIPVRQTTVGTLEVISNSLVRIAIMRHSNDRHRHHKLESMSEAMARCRKLHERTYRRHKAWTQQSTMRIGKLVRPRRSQGQVEGSEHSEKEYWQGLPRPRSRLWMTTLASNVQTTSETRSEDGTSADRGGNRYNLRTFVIK